MRTAVARSNARLSRRAESLTSRRFYESGIVDKKLISLIEIAKAEEPKKLKTEQSRHLPYWAWYIIAKCNGIPLKHGERPILGTILHALTFASALSYGVSYTWFKVYDIMSVNVHRDIPGGTVSIFLVFCWCAFGFYCKTLCSRLFLHQRFLKDVRVHSRTVFKISATFLAVLLGLLFSVSHIYEATDILDRAQCEGIELDFSVCVVLSISSTVFTLFTLVWHSLVSFVFISVCRTHTIGLRCFIKEIESDSSLLQQCHSSIYKNISFSAEDSATDISDSVVKVEEGTAHYSQSSENCPLEQHGEISVLLSPLSENLQNSAFVTNGGETSCGEEDGPHESDKGFYHSVEQSAGRSGSSAMDAMSCSEILHNFWKLNRRLRFSSAALQRWFASFIALVLLRCSTYLVHWLGHTATVLDILQFVVPLIYLIVLSSALAEVNFEGQRFQRSLYPTEERLKLFQFLALNPLQMPVYGFGVTHGTIVTVVFAILVGFITRIVITELTK